MWENLYSCNLEKADIETFNSGEKIALAASIFAQKPTDDIIPITIFEYVIKNKQIIEISKLRLCEFKNHKRHNFQYLWPFYVNDKKSISRQQYYQVLNYEYENKDLDSEKFSTFVRLNIIDRESSYYIEDEIIPPYIYDEEEDTYYFYSVYEDRGTDFLNVVLLEKEKEVLAFG